MNKKIQLVFILSILFFLGASIYGFFHSTISGLLFLVGFFISMYLYASSDVTIKPPVIISSFKRIQLIVALLLMGFFGVNSLVPDKKTSDLISTSSNPIKNPIDTIALKDFQEHWIDSVVKDWKGNYIVKGFSNKTLNLISFQLSNDASKKLGNIDEIQMRILQENYDTLQDRKLGKLFRNNLIKIQFVLDPEQKKINDVKEERQHLIDRQFAGFSGANVYVQRAIKENMNDPDSYDHIETSYSDKGKYILVYTKFRGKNSFGAIIIQNVIAKVDIEGNVISLK